MLIAVFRLTVGALLLAGAFTPVSASAAEKTVRDWTATCRDDGACSAVTVITSKNASAADYVLHFDRDGQAGSAFTLAIATSVHLMDRDRPIEIRIDDEAPLTLRPGRDYGPYGALNDFYITGKAALARLLPQMLAGNALRLSYLDVSGAPHDVDFSLSGLAAALLWIDERQDRVGEARIAAAPTHLAPAPHRAATDIVAAGGLPPQVLERHRIRSDCEDPESGVLREIAPIVAPLSKTAILYAIPCTAGAYNVSYRLYVVESGEIGGTSTLYFADYSDSHGWSGTDLLVNIDFDAKEKRLTSFYKGRGLGDCGSMGSWRWKDYAFAMEEFRAWSRCDGTRTAEKWPVVFSAGQ